MFSCILPLPYHIKTFFSVSLNILLLYSLKTSPVKKHLILALRCKTKVFFFLKKKILLTTVFSNELTKQKGLNFKLSRFISFIKFKSALKSFIKFKSFKIKLVIVGVGYKFLKSFIDENGIIEIKAGYSHKIYLKLPKNISIVFLKSTEIILTGYCYNTLLNTVMIIKKFRLPNPYKKKGVFFKNEKITLKQGKTC